MYPPRNYFSPDSADFRTITTGDSDYPAKLGIPHTCGPDTCGVDSLPYRTTPAPAPSVTTEDSDYPQYYFPFAPFMTPQESALEESAAHTASAGIRVVRTDLTREESELLTAVRVLGEARKAYENAQEARRNAVSAEDDARFRLDDAEYTYAGALSAVTGQRA